MKDSHQLLRRLLEENVTLARELEELRSLRRLRRPSWLSRLPNRQVFTRLLAQELALSASGATGEGSLLLIAVNDINLVSAHQGRAAADEVVREIVDATRASLVGPDVCCRTGGRELMVLLPGAGVRDAHRTMARVRAAVIRTGARRDLAISVSVVSASWPVDGVAIAALCHKAEGAMQVEKRRLRGRARHSRPASGRVLAVVK